MHDKFRGVQILRYIAAILVVYAHMLDQIARWNRPAPWSATLGYIENFGAIGVDIFFVISGFVIVHTIRSKDGWTAGDFAARRFLRVAPIYFLLSLPFMAMTLLKTGFRLDEFAATFLFFPVAGPEFTKPYITVGWTLCFEMVFYAAAALTLIRGGAFIRPAHVLAMFALVALAAISLDNTALDFFGNAIFCEFLFGAFIAWLWHKGLRGFGWPALALGLACCAALVAYGYGEVSEARLTFNNELSLLRIVLFGIPSALIVYGVVQIESRIPDTRLVSALIYAGGASYALYLIHPGLVAVLSRVIRHVPLGGDALVFAVLVAATAASLAVYRYLERPMTEALQRKRSALRSKVHRQHQT